MVWYQKQAAPAEQKFRTTAVERADIAAKVTATGTMSARITVQVGTQVSGRVQDIFVDFNSTVKKGQVIAKIDPRLFQAAMARASASAAQARGQLERARTNQLQAERNLERAKVLHKEGLLGTSDLEIAQTAVESARADVAVAKGSIEQASAQAGEARVNLELTTIVSPIDGIVLSRNVDVGQTVAASLQSPVLFTIAQDLRSIQVDTYVAESDVGKLKPGMEATFTVDAYPGQRFKGTVRDVRNAAQTMQNVVTYDAVLDVDNSDLRLKPGMTANVTFVHAEAKGALVVPNAAMRFRPPAEAFGSASAGRRWGGAGGGPGGGRRGGRGDGEGSGKVVWVLRDGKPHRVRIETGVTDGSSTEVTSGELAEGDQVIVEYTAPAGAKPTSGGAPPGGNVRGGGRLF